MKEVYTSRKKAHSSEKGRRTQGANPGQTGENCRHLPVRQVVVLAEHINLGFAISICVKGNIQAVVWFILKLFVYIPLGF